jgi:putative sugar O-methyltransferase
MNRTSISDDNIYPHFCESACEDDNIFNVFRSNNKYSPILEHVSKEYGDEYLDIIKRDNINLLDHIDKFKTNDDVGNPVKYEYDIGHFSPTTIRYIKVVSDLIKIHGKLDGMDIVEIGCGYGGQAKMIMDVYDVRTYTLIDLDPVLKLTQKYLESFDLDKSKIYYKTIKDLTTSDKYDLAISNYAYTECVKSIQSEYFDKVLSKSINGYITANFVNDSFGLDYFTKHELLDKFEKSYELPEEPNTHENNFLLIWK